MEGPMRQSILCSVALGAFFLLTSYVGQDLRSVEPTQRAKFASDMAQLVQGMPKTQVEKILGKPDDIKTQNDPGGIPTNETKEIWCYGTNGHLTFPTLGQVFIREDNRVQYIYGNAGTAPDATM